jgi:hypothetical protein
MKVVAGQRWVDALSDRPVTIMAAYSTEVAIRYDDGVEATIPRDWLEEVYYPRHLEVVR